MKKFAVIAALLTFAATEARAQVFTPTFQAPYTSSDIGVYVSDAGSELGIEGILRRSMGSYDLGLRLGFADDAVLLGADVRNPLSIAGTAPLGIALTLGGQGALGDANIFGAQAGLSVGYAFRSPGLTVTPYIHPRAVLLFGDVADEGLDAQADVGVDVGFAPNLVFRFGANLGDGADWGIGLALRR